ncbi:MAG: (2Fe-2S)-binding protein [Deltaproteobacteria bacterium]|nr:(2Fe-2S)-binding protein [Deltaproteobacteria bacterium]
MPTVTIDAKQYEAQAGETIIRVAERNGIDIPSYCWHPALSVAANCRMCLVEVEKQPKLQPACQWAIADGMVVHTRSPKVLEARRAVMEFLLLNHPVDCPICDQAGECKLQDYWYEHDGKASRLVGEKVHKPKAERLGPLVVYDAERCIRCTRCVRFCTEIAKDPVLAVGNRGNHAEIILDQGRKLDHAYSMMTAHICPVGALTTTDFRFQARVWMLESTPTICPGCATGCNAWIDQTRGVAKRMRPRDNPEVNDFWMCDDGCLTYKRVEEDRVLCAAVGRGAARKETSVAAALTEAARAIGQVPAAVVAAVLGSEHTSEDNFVLVKLARDLLQKGTGALYLTGRPPGEADDLLRHADKNPNTVGAVQAAAPSTLRGFEDLLNDADAGSVKAAIVLGAHAPVPEAELAPLGKLDVLVVLCANRGPLSELATHVLPAASWAEVSGTFVNAKGQRQRLRPAAPPRGDSLPAWDLLGRLARKMDLALEYKTLGEVERAATPAQVTA